VECVREESSAKFTPTLISAEDWERYDKVFEETPFAIATSEKNTFKLSTYKALKDGKEWNRKASEDR